MQLIRTTLRIPKQIKKEAERYAVETDTTLQEVFNRSLEEYLQKKAKKKAERIVFHSHNLGNPLDKLKRGNYYD